MRWLRVLAGLDVFQLRQCSVSRLYLAESGEGWCISPEALTPESVVYSFGVGRDIDFERALIERFGVTVHAFDPTPISLDWIAAQRVPDRFVLHPIGLADFDGVARFAPPLSPRWESFSLARAPAAGAAIEAPVQRLATIAAGLGHARLDLVKMDIEGAEYRVLPDLLASGIRPRQLLVEFHHRWREIGPRQTREAIRLLNRGGYKIAEVSPSGMEYTFILTGA